MFHLIEGYSVLVNFILYTIICLSVTFVLDVLLCPIATKNPKSYPSLYNIYFLKILLTYGIVLHHIFIHTGIWNKADICVEFFFILSGFMLVHTSSFQKQIKDFIISRVIQFVPYIFLANSLSLFGQDYINIKRFLSGLFLLTTTPFYPFHTYYMPCWYLCVLFWISLFYYLITNYFATKSFLIINMITFLSFVAMCFQDAPIESFNSVIPFLTNGFIRGFACMGIGYLIAHTHDCKNILSHHKTLLSALELFLIVFLMVSLFNKQYFFYSSVNILCFSVLFKLFLLKYGFISKYLEQPMWKNWSKFTFPIYMSHDVIVPVMIYGFHIWDSFSNPVKLMISLICPTFFGILIYYMFFLAQICHKKIFKYKEGL